MGRKNDIVVVGSSNMDLVINLPRIPLKGETILGGTSSMIFGGKGANQAVAAARSGGKITFITKLGNDIFGEKIKKHFIQQGLPARSILEDKKHPTGIAQIFVSDAGENVIAVAPGANGHLTILDIKAFENIMSKVRLILVQLEIPIKTVEYVARFAAKNNIKLVLNPAPGQSLSQNLLKNTWLITPNESEASLISGIPVNDLKSAQKAGEVLLKQGIQHVIITLGDQGCLWCSHIGVKLFPAFNVKAVDTTAAGDVFNGALVVALSQDLSFDQAIVFANAAASISVTRKGAQPSIPYVQEILKQIKKAQLDNNHL